MTGFGWLNFGSLVLGLIAWILPFVNFRRYEKHNHKHWVTLSLMSISACAISLSFQIFYIYHKVKIEDWSALMDTMGAVAFVSAVLLIVTIILNAMILIVYHDRTTVVKRMTSIRFLFICLFFLTIIGCENGTNGDLITELEEKNKTIIELEQTIYSLEEEKRKLQKDIKHKEMEKEHFSAIANQAYHFVRAHISGDGEAIQSFLGDNMKLIEKDHNLYVTYPYSGEEVEVRLYHEDSPYMFQDMLIQGFGYFPDEEVYRIHIREFYEHIDPKHEFLPTFLNLTFEQVEGSWKIVMIEFDV